MLALGALLCLTGTGGGDGAFGSGEMGWISTQAPLQHRAEPVRAALGEVHNPARNSAADSFRRGHSAAKGIMLAGVRSPIIASPVGAGDALNLCFHILSSASLICDSHNKYKLRSFAVCGYANK